VKITVAEWAASAAAPSQFPTTGLAEIAFVGRSNVGKSSLLNCLVNRKSLARVANSPGKTRLVNFFLINNVFYMVDLPGYGYARVSQETKRKWARLVEQYLHGREALRLVVLLLDIRHRPTSDDRSMYEWLVYFQFPTVIVATKADKIARGKWPVHLRQIREELGLGSQGAVIPFSTQAAWGKEELWKVITQYL